MGKDNYSFAPQCPIPNAQSPMPNAQSPIPNAQSPRFSKGASTHPPLLYHFPLLTLALSAN
ncbi:hypothetical protein [aff. Roholtiella sp. LEGE 12411]|uniref:hypothetical protein n=1 Tax=aff. Roholtiella sp. LEGE 12411 TaxID=1828822 RepID=UPI00188240F8|nr:hypothetical protein [aff. Roholtiella sp. LEGE 12411]MBE9036708.1 hypothetical protein [aff. Roholtiella sp. LEGE 12411]